MAAACNCGDCLACELAAMRARTSERRRVVRNRETSARWFAIHRPFGTPTTVALWKRALSRARGAKRTGKAVSS